MNKKVIVPYESLEKIIKGYASWVYSGSGISVLDADKKIYFHIENNQLEIAVKSSSVLIKSMVNANIDIDTDSWDFILEYQKLKEIIETYQKLACTYIQDIMFQLDPNEDRIIKMTLKEVPKEGYPTEYNQLQKYKYQQPATIKVNHIFQDLEIPTNFVATNTKDLSELSEMIIPKLISSKEDNNKIQFEADNVFIKDLNSLFCYRNTCLNSLPNGLALGVEGASVLRSVVKALKGYETIPIGMTKTHLVMTPENMIIYITKGSLVKPLRSVLQPQNVVFEVVINGGYLLDILKRYDKVDDDVSLSFYGDSCVGYFKASEITQRVHLESMTERADQQRILINTKLLQKMLMKTDSIVRLSFIERKGRSGSNFYMCYLDSGKNSTWTSILYVRKG